MAFFFILLYAVVLGFWNLAWALSNQNIRIPTTTTKMGDPPTPLSNIWADKRGVIAKSCFRILKHCIRSYVTKNSRFLAPKYLGTPRTMRYLGGQRGVMAKSWLRVLKLCICLLRGWGRCLKVNLQTCVLKNFRTCRWGAKHRHGSDDPHQQEWKICSFIWARMCQFCSDKGTSRNLLWCLLCLHGSLLQCIRAAHTLHLAKC